MLKPVTLQGGFSLVETLTLVALLGVITSALYTIMNNITTQSERMRVMADLLRQGDRIKNEMMISAQRAGHKKEIGAAMTRSQALNFVTASHVQLCADNISGTRQLTEYRLSTLTDGKGRLEKRISSTACTADADEDWESVTPNMLTAVEFSMDTTTPPSLILKSKFTLSKTVPGSGEVQTLTQQHLLPTYALVGLD